MYFSFCSLDESHVWLLSTTVMSQPGRVWRWKEIEQKSPSEVDQRSPVCEELRAQTPRLLGGRGSAEDPVLLAPRLFQGMLTRITWQA